MMSLAHFNSYTVEIQRKQYTFEIIVKLIVTSDWSCKKKKKYEMVLKFYVLQTLKTLNEFKLQ